MPPPTATATPDVCPTAPPGAISLILGEADCYYKIGDLNMAAGYFGQVTNPSADTSPGNALLHGALALERANPKIAVIYIRRAKINMERGKETWSDADKKVLKFALARIDTQTSREALPATTGPTLRCEDQASDQDDRAFSIGECYYQRKNFKSASHWFLQGNSARCPSFAVCFHAAEALEKTRDFDNASLYLSLATSTDDAKNLSAARKNALMRYLSVLLDKAARVARAERVAEANREGLSDDEKQTWIENGKPCHQSSSQGVMGYLTIWYYQCDDRGIIGKESYTFANGRLIDHTQL